MVAIHPRFESEMFARLQDMVGNAYGRVGIWADPGEGPWENLAFGPEVSTVASIGSFKDGGWDCLVCIAQLWKMPELGALTDSLRDGRRMFFVEPVASFGIANRVQRLSRAALEKRYGLDFHCDLPQALRDAGTAPTSVDRFRLGSPVFTFVAGEARVY
jgi:hypothetical protein